MSRIDEAATLLAADVGGTNTRFGLFRTGSHGPEPVRTETVPSDPALPFGAVLGRFLSGASGDAPAAACFAVAGPVIEDRAAMTNHPWVLDARELSRTLAGVPIRLVNDLAAAAVALPHLPPDRLVEILPGVDTGRRGTVAVLAPGTGLGGAGLHWDGVRHRPLASEGGHADFAPRHEDEVALWHYLHGRHPHVSYERILSGPGLVTLYGFLRERGTPPEAPRMRERLATASDAAALISHAAIAEGDPLSGAALGLFARILGAKAGNLALEFLALGGVFIAGGIAPKILPRLTTGAVREAFLDKGRHRPLLERVPLHVSLEPGAALLGAARLAYDTTRA